MKYFILSTSLLASIFLSASPLALAAASNPFNQVCSTSPEASSSALCTDTSNSNPLTSGNNGVLINVANIIAIVAGVAAVIIIIISGLMYVTSGGDSERINSAKNTILYAVIGLVVIAVARFIIAFVVGQL